MAKTKPSDTTNNEYERFLSRASFINNPDGFAYLRKDYLKFLDLEQTGFLSFLVYELRFKHSEWTHLPEAKLEKELHLSGDKQRRILSHLQNLGILTVKRMGIGALRHVSIDLIAIEKLIDQYT